MQITDRFWNQYKNSLQFLDKLMGQQNENIENKVKRGKLKEEYSRICLQRDPFNKISGNRFFITLCP